MNNPQYELNIKTDVATTKMTINITGYTPDKLIAQLKQAVQYFEGLQKERLEKVPAVFRDYTQAVKVNRYDLNRFAISIEQEDSENEYYSCSNVSSARIGVNEKYYIEPTPHIAEWMKSNKPYENFYKDYYENW